MGLDMFDKKSDMMKAIDKHFAKVKKIHALPEYQDFLKYRKELEQWGEFVMDKRLERMQPLMNQLFGDALSDGKELTEWLKRIIKLEDRLSLIQRKKGYSFSTCNVMDLVWEYFKKYGEATKVEGMFGNEAYQIGQYTMEIYSGQGDYGYSINKPQRIY